MTPQPARRVTDIPPAVQLAIDEGDSDTRHVLRGELGVVHTELSNKIDAATRQIVAGNLQNVADHAEVKAELAPIKQAIGTVPGLDRRVTALEGHDQTESAVAAALREQQKAMHANRVAIRNYALGLAALIVSIAVPLLILVLQRS